MNVKRERLYGIWTTMRMRCENPRDRKFALYGGRGIKVCAEWSDYRAFRAYVVTLPHYNEPGRMIDRINNDGDYAPGNVRWATNVEQADNRRSNHYITLLGERKTIKYWALDSRCAVIEQTLRTRLSKGWTFERAFTTPARLYGRS